MSQFTVLGARGLIGSRLAASLARDGHEVRTPLRDDDLTSRSLGHVIYAIGLTSDFRTRTFDTMTAHVCRLNEILQECRFESLLYLSSTRVYQGLSGAVDETTDLVVNPRRMDDLYNLSKLAGESLALASGRPTRIARISNVYDPRDLSDNFLSSVIRSAVTTGEVTLDSAADSAKDYVRLDDVVYALPRIALAGRGRVYNVCSGTNLSHAQLAQQLATLVPCRVRYATNATASTFPTISNRRLLAEFSFRPCSLVDDLPALVAAYRGCRELTAC